MVKREAYNFFSMFYNEHCGDSVSSFGKLGLFVQGDLDFGDRDETELESGYDFDSWSLTVGGDYRFTDQLFAGLSASVGEVEVDYAGDGGSTDISNWTVSLYSGWSPTENIYIDGLVSYGASDIESARNINYTDSGGSWNSIHNGDTDGDQLFIGINTGYMLSRNSWRFGPTASLTYLEGSIDGFVENSEGIDSQAWNFAVEGQDYESLRLSLGVQADYIFTTSFGVIIPGIRVSYVMEQEDEADQIDMRLVNNPFSEQELSSSQIVVRTDGQDSGFLDTSLNLSGQFIMGFSGFVSYRFYSSYDDYSREGIAIGLRWDKPF
jgi:outer membrane autotransporter protein